MDEQLIKKLHFKTEFKILIFNASNDFIKSQSIVSFDTQIIEKQYDAALVFIHNKSEADNLMPQVINNLKHDGVLWGAYPKGTSKIKTDINRDKSWEIVNSLGLTTVSAISVDDIWSALRFRPIEKVKRKGDN